MMATLIILGATAAMLLPCIFTIHLYRDDEENDR